MPLYCLFVLPLHQMMVTDVQPLRYMIQKFVHVPSDFPHVRWRAVFALLGSIGMAIVYGLKVNLSVTIVAMINHTHLELHEDHHR